jgi:hypothetical protein
MQGNGIIEWEYRQIWYDYLIPVLCDCKMVDFLIGTVLGHNVSFFTEGVFLKADQQWRGKVKSTNSPYEEFDINAKGHNTNVDIGKGIVMIRYNALGNRGTNYRGIWKYNLKTESFATIIRAFAGK